MVAPANANRNHFEIGDKIYTQTEADGAFTQSHAIVTALAAASNSDMIIDSTAVHANTDSENLVN